MMSTQPTSLGKPLNAFKPCCWTTMPSTIATRLAGFHDQEPRSCMGWSTAENVGTNWLCSTKAEPDTSATFCARNTVCPFASIFQETRSIPTIVQAFFQALSPVELDVYSRAVAAQQQATSQVSHAHHQHLERLRYEAALAERQFLRVDPDNRLVAAALEKRWNEALAELKRVEEAEAQRDAPALPLLSLSEELQMALKRDWPASSCALAAGGHFSTSEKGAVTLPH